MRIKRLLSHAKVQNLVKEFECLAPQGDRNKRQVNCKRCGDEVEPGLAVKWLWIKADDSDEYSCWPLYFCPVCHAFWSNVYWTFDEYIAFRVEMSEEDRDRVRQYVERWGVKLGNIALEDLRLVT